MTHGFLPEDQLAAAPSLLDCGQRQETALIWAGPAGAPGRPLVGQRWRTRAHYVVLGPGCLGLLLPLTNEIMSL